MELIPNNYLDYENLKKLEALVIEALSPPSIPFDDENSKTSFTLLDLEKKAQEMVTTLANGSFSHSLSTIGNVPPNLINSIHATCNTIDSDLFAYVATDQISSDKFYEIIINNDASKHSTAGYR